MSTAVASGSGFARAMICCKRANTASNWYLLWDTLPKIGAILIGRRRHFSGMAVLLPDSAIASAGFSMISRLCKLTRES